MDPPIASNCALPQWFAIHVVIVAFDQTPAFGASASTPLPLSVRPKIKLSPIHAAAAMVPISAAFVGTSMETFNRLMLFQSWI